MINFRKYFFIVSALFFSIVATAQEEVNKLDDKGRKNGSWKGVYPESNRLRYEGTFSHGKEKGVFKFYEGNKNSTLAATRDFTAKDGSCYTIFYDEKGKKAGEGKELNRQRVGTWKFYHEGRETLMSVEEYSKGQLTGVRKVFFPDGTIAEEITYSNGIKEGIYKKYTEKGIVLEESRYKNDLLHGQATFRDSQGQLVAEGKFTNGSKTGIWKFYEKGKLVKEENKSASKRHK